MRLEKLRDDNGVVQDGDYECEHGVAIDREYLMERLAAIATGLITTVRYANGITGATTLSACILHACNLHDAVLTTGWGLSFGSPVFPFL